MPTLITKTQYNSYESGEFDDEKERTFEETLHLIESFPWEVQREHVSIALTNPSITIQGLAGDYLKLAIYYHEQFTLYYLDPSHHLHTCKFNSYQNAYPAIRSFFEQECTNGTFDAAGFRREPTPFQNNIVHFRDKAFNYSMNAVARMLVIVLFTIIVLCILFVNVYFFNEAPSRAHGPIIFMILMMLLIGIPGIILYINHWLAAYGKVLILSRGKEVFYYGPSANPAAYNKNDILEVVTIGTRGRGGYPPVTRIQINFKNGTAIDISCMILNQMDLVSKFPQCTCREEKKLSPFMYNTAG